LTAQEPFGGDAARVVPERVAHLMASATDVGFSQACEPAVGRLYEPRRRRPRPAGGSSNFAPRGLSIVDDMAPELWVDEEHERNARRLRHTLVDDPTVVTAEPWWSSGVVLAAKAPTHGHEA
jgi:hypothetical protein